MKAIFLIPLLLLSSVAAAAETRPAVVELFTSQGCSSCPPADALLGELAKRPDVVALGFHITYWDGAQWRDPLSLREATDRQTAYDQRLTGGQIYTPQMVIDGTADAVGSDRGAVLAALANARPATLAAVAFAADRRSVTIAPGTAAATAPGTAAATAPGTTAGTTPGGASVLLARYDLARATQVKGGENAGRSATDFNGVTALTTLGAWEGKTVSFPIAPPAQGEGLAVLVQAPDGRFYGAAALSPLS